ncbi:hypothetical protein HDF24_18805 [Mucilaginibacter sp. X4EP1]|nr:hypothetical protein [Mucilaginibacter sp. X4EP1]
MLREPQQDTLFNVSNNTLLTFQNGFFIAKATFFALAWYSQEILT